MPEGKVKFFHDRKGYGFITPDEGGDDVFVHMNDVSSDSDLREGERVSYEVEETPKGLQATNVERLGY